MRSAYRHDGAARSLVHRLKYHAAPLPGVGRLLSGLLPDSARALVPVPRVAVRRWRYGVDPARELALALGAASGLPVVEALRPPLWVHRRAGPAQAARGTPRFAVVIEPPRGAVLVDDVVTTGTTLAAAAICGATLAITLTAGHHRPMAPEVPPRRGLQGIR